MSDARADELGLLTSFISTLDLRQVPSEVRERARLTVLDILGVTIAGSKERSTELIHDQLASIGGREEASVIGRGMLPAMHATLVNASAAHAVELAEGASRAAVHAGNASILAALAVCERDDLSGADLLRATIAGYEVSIRVGWALNSRRGADTWGDQAEALKRGWWTPSMLGGFGAAAAVSSARRLDDGQLRHALGIAASSAPAATNALVREGPMAKPLSMGVAAAGGVLAADLAARGFTGLRDVVGGWFPPLNPEAVPERLSDGLGDRWEIMDTLFKPFACMGPIFAALEATLGIVAARPLAPDEIRDVLVEGYQRTLDYADPAPTSPEGARTSLPYCVAAAVVLRDRHAFLGEAFEEERLADQRIRRLMPRIRTALEPEFDRLYPFHAAKARVTITTASGERLVREVDRDALPFYHRPTYTDIADKFRVVATPSLGPDRVARLIAMADELEKLPRARQLAALLRR